AEAGAEAHPARRGGRACIALRDTLRAPSIVLNARRVDGVGMPSLWLEHRNLARLHLRAYPWDPVAALARAPRRGGQPDPQAIAALLAETPAADWTVDLPPTPDLRDHRTHVVPPLEMRGSYVIVASQRADFADVGDNVRQAVLVTLSDLVLISRPFEDDDDRPVVEITARRGQDGAPAGDVALTVQRIDPRRQNLVTVAEARTGDDGRARFDAGGWARHTLRLTATRADGTSLLMPDALFAWENRRSAPAMRLVLTTDRAVYRPGQRVRFKLVAFRPADARPDDRASRAVPRWRTAGDAEIAVALRDANGEIVAETTLTTDDYGSAADAFDVPAAGRMLGAWSLGAQMRANDARASVGVRVEAYRRPTFAVEIDPPDAPPRPNETVTLRGRGRYFFGLPVTDGVVRWTVERRIGWPIGWRGGWRPAPIDVGAVTIAQGETALGDDGDFAITFVPAIDPRDADDPQLRERIHHYAVRATLVDGGGESRDAARDVRVGWTRVRAALDAPPPFVRAGEPVTLALALRDLDQRG
ncbi:MAG: MG2 domain-containing protein, partial [Acidobacteriota bacterium]